jgi:hypothetical protein
MVLTKCGIQVRIFIMSQVRTSLFIRAPRVVLGCTLARKHVQNVGGENGWKAIQIASKGKVKWVSSQLRGLTEELNVSEASCFVYVLYSGNTTYNELMM